jgi:hypothetical protein
MTEVTQEYDATNYDESNYETAESVGREQPQQQPQQQQQQPQQQQQQPQQQPQQQQPITIEEITQDYIKAESFFKNMSKDNIEIIQRELSPEQFTESLQEEYGENYNNILNSFRSNTNFLSMEDKNILNSLPSGVKMLILKTANGIQEKIAKDYAERYGIKNNVNPQPQRSNESYGKEFDDLTMKLINNDYKSGAEYKSIQSRRMEVAKILDNNKRRN